MYTKKSKGPKPTLGEKMPMRKIVFVRDNFTCQDCKRKFPEEKNYRGHKIEDLTLGHVIPRCLGGLFIPENLRAQCYDCNQKLGDKIWAKELRRALTHYVLN